MKQSYLERNKLGFEGDNFIAKKIDDLVIAHKIDTIFETGTYYGHTTRRLASAGINTPPHKVIQVHTIEINPEFYNEGRHLNDVLNVKRYLGNSPDKLNEILPSIKGNNLFFLDAHWGNVCPLKAELEVIAKYDENPVIVIHDWKVPGRPDLGFDSYNGQEFTFEWIKNELDSIYGSESDYEVSYNEEAEGALRGVIYIVPKAVTPLVKYEGVEEGKKKRTMSEETKAKIRATKQKNKK